jgi:hypothetical protein
MDLMNVLCGSGGELTGRRLFKIDRWPLPSAMGNESGQGGTLPCKPWKTGCKRRSAPMLLYAWGISMENEKLSPEPLFAESEKSINFYLPVVPDPVAYRWN